MFKPELLSPAGTLKNMRYAFAYGADAVYAGQPRYSLRVRNNEFNHENLQLGINEAHALGKKFYVVVNIAPHNAKLKNVYSRSEAGGGDGSGRADHVRSGFNHAGAGTLPGDADPSFSAGQRRQLGDGQILAADGAHPRDPVA
ncbi:Putative protease [Klebsiella pneumoniae IS39]|nr:Putative protease [Klebsiella pneumoniae IS39]